MTRRILPRLVLLSALLIGLPLLGVALSDEPVARYLEFPPVTRYVEHAPFSWTAFVLIGSLEIALLAAAVRLVTTGRSAGPFVGGGVAIRFPSWGWLGVVSLAVCWLLAWTRFDWFEPFQPYTFIPLWLSYVLLVNAAAFRRSGRCLLTHRPVYLATLFPLSALFWWYFEFLNRFVQNWYYVGVEDFGPLAYAVHDTLAFSTVLPAVISTSQWLATFPALGGIQGRPVTLPRHPRVYAIVALVLASAGLTGIGIWPEVLYPLLWIAPLVLVVSLQVMNGESTLLGLAARGNWRVLCLPVLAALVCGLLWEMWNYYSHAKWHYSIPWVQRFEIFEMPLLGYAGYLFFGLECAVVAALVNGLASEEPSRQRGR